jgi:hypothetical protein
MLVPGWCMLYFTLSLKFQSHMFETALEVLCVCLVAISVCSSNNLPQFFELETLFLIVTNCVTSCAQPHRKPLTIAGYILSM